MPNLSMVDFLEVFERRRRKLLPRHVLRALAKNTAFFVALNLAFGFMVPRIDNSAHVGGLIAGLICGLTLSPDFGRRAGHGRGRRLAGAAAIAIALALCAVYVQKRVLDAPRWADPFFVRGAFEDIVWMEQQLRGLPSIEADIAKGGAAVRATRESIRRTLGLLAAARGRIARLPDAPTKPLALRLAGALRQALEALVVLRGPDAPTARARFKLAEEKAFRCHGELVRGVDQSSPPR